MNGTLFPRKTSVTPTLASRLIELWRHISKARTRFESRPDTGFIGKGMTRHANRVWNYGVKGLLGTMALVFVFPVVCVAVSVASVALAVLAPVWVPAVTLAVHVFMWLVYDFDGPLDLVGRPVERWCVLVHTVVWTLGVQALVQPVAAVLVATTVCPVAAVAVAMGELLEWHETGREPTLWVCHRPIVQLY